MICELCGRNFNYGSRVEVEGSVVSACEACARLGKVVSPIVAVKEKPKPVDVQKPVYEMADVEPEVVLADDYGLRVKNAREKRNLKQAGLARLIDEPESMVHRIESERFEPGDALIKKLEHALGISLSVKAAGAPRLVGRSGGVERTLGDVIVVRKKRGDV
ncbi:MAG: multiprotein bridging factor aMBF1 [Candidatus Altiarchaeota archaeon]|nr:multiprotein bridging factor aMBF1 [Candidatus Altiarchaeota archaeon]